MAAKYGRIADDMRRKIETGTFVAGEKLPAETELTALYRVSLNTLRRAMDLLEAEGRLERRQGIGNFVRAPRPPIRRSPDRYQWEKDRVLQPEAERMKTGATEYDTGLTIDALEFPAVYDTIEAPPDLADVFGVDAGSRLLRRTYRTRMRGADSPLQLIRSYLVYDVVAENPALVDSSREPWPGGTQHQLYTIGIELDRIVDHITARPPQGDEAEDLRMLPGVALIVIRKVSYDTTDRVVELSDVLMPGDRTELEYTTKLRRWPA